MIKIPENIGDIYDAESNRTFLGQEILTLTSIRSDEYAKNGIRSGDKLIICHGNSILFFIDLLACWQIGACAIPVDPSISTNELGRIVQLTEAKKILHRFEDASRFSDFSSMLQRSELPKMEFSGTQKSSGSPGSSTLDDDALILFTSGSTNVPKGVVHTFRSLLAKIAIYNQVLTKSDWQHTLCIIPTHFVYGLMSNSIGPLFLGNKIYVYPPFSLEILGQLASIIQKHQITAFCSVPSMWKIIFSLCQIPEQNSLRKVHCAAAPLSRDLWLKIKAWTHHSDIKNAYGATEMACAITGPSDNQDFVDGLIGKGWNTELRIVKDDGSFCAKGEIGQVIIQGPSMMKGYFKNPEATREAIRNGWYYPGDLGYVNEDGDVILVGRVKNVINKAGMKIFPEDVEALLLENENLVDACVFGWPDEIAGELVAAAVVFRKHLKNTSTESLEKWTREKISAFQVPSKWFVLDEIPRSSRGKINRKTLLDMLKRN